MQAAKGFCMSFSWVFLKTSLPMSIWTSTWCQRDAGTPRCKPITPHLHSCSCSTPSGSCSTTDLPRGEEKATQQWVGNSQVTSHVPSLQAGNGAEAQEPPASRLVSHSEASREIVPIRSLFQGVSTCRLWKPWPLGSCVAVWSLPRFCLASQTGSCLHGGHQTVGHVRVQIQLLKMILIAAFLRLQLQGWWKVVEQMLFLMVPDYIMVDLLLTASISHFYISPQPKLQSATVLHIPSWPGILSAVGHPCDWGCWAHVSAQPHFILFLCSHSCLYPLDGGGESTHGPRTLIHQLRSTEVRWWGQLAFIYRITESLGLEKAPNIIKASLWQRPPCQPNSSTKCHIQSLNIIPVNVNFRSYWVANHICLWD